MNINPAVPVAQIDGFISDTPDERKMTMDDIGYRFEGHFFACGGENAARRYEMTRGMDLIAKGLKYPGYTTPSNVRLVGICPDCGKSFCFHGYSFYMAQSDVAYSDDGLDCCQIQAYDIDKDTWMFESDGKISVTIIPLVVLIAKHRILIIKNIPKTRCLVFRAACILAESPIKPNK